MQYMEYLPNVQWPINKLLTSTTRWMHHTWTALIILPIVTVEAHITYNKSLKQSYKLLISNH